MKRILMVPAMLCLALVIVVQMSVLGKKEFVMVDVGSYRLVVNQPVARITGEISYLSSPDRMIRIIPVPRSCAGYEPVPVLDFKVGSIRCYVQQCRKR